MNCIKSCKKELKFDYYYNFYWSIRVKINYYFEAKNLIGYLWYILFYLKLF